MSPYQAPSEESPEARTARESLAEFIRAGWHVLEPTTPLDWNWHIDAVAVHIQAALDDWHRKQLDPGYVQRLRNLLINIPPGTGKSRIVSVFAPAWMWLKCPSWRSIFLSANPRVALRDSVYCRELIESDWYQQTFRPEWKLAADQNAKGLFRNTAGGARQAMGIMARITGDRADALFIDDPHDAEEAKSDAMRVAITDRWDSAIANRVNDLRSSVRIGIMQRLHELDWSGHILRQGGWDHLCLPMEYEPERYDPLNRDHIPPVTAIGWRDPRTTPGELLFPTRFPREVLDQERSRLGGMGYAGQHQQRPSPGEGAIFKLAWFERRYRRLPELKEVWTTWDTALKADQQNDESACCVMGLGVDGLVYVLRVANGRWETPDLVKFLIEQADWLRGLYGDRYRGDYVEDKVSGTTLMQFVRRSRPDLALIPVRVDLDKVARAQGVTPICEAGQVVLPDPAAYPSATWTNTLLAQLSAFPNAAHDDVVDAFVYGLKRVMGTLCRTGDKKPKRRGSGYV